MVSGQLPVARENWRLTISHIYFHCWQLATGNWELRNGNHRREFRLRRRDHPPGLCGHDRRRHGPYLDAVNNNDAADVENNGGGKIVDRFTVDLSLTSTPKNGSTRPVGGAYSGGYAKNGSVMLNLEGTTPTTIDLTALAVATGVCAVAGDTAFGSYKQLVFRNLGAAACAVSEGASNGIDIGLAGSGPSLAIDAASVVTILKAGGVTVDSSNKTITFTPAASTVLAVSIGGA